MGGIFGKKPDTSAQDKAIAEQKAATEAESEKLKKEEAAKKRALLGRGGRSLLTGTETGTADTGLKQTLG